MIHDNCMVSRGGLGGQGVIPQKNFENYSSNGVTWGISEQNFEAILARSGALLCHLSCLESGGFKRTKSTGFPGIRQ